MALSGNERSSPSLHTLCAAHTCRVVELSQWKGPPRTGPYCNSKAVSHATLPIAPLARERLTVTRRTKAKSRKPSIFQVASAAILAVLGTALGVPAALL